ncbi:unnamed protein product [Merluccius merluccius]
MRSNARKKGYKVHLKIIWTPIGPGDRSQKVLVEQQNTTGVFYELGPVTHDHQGVYTCHTVPQPDTFTHDWHDIIWVAVVTVALVSPVLPVMEGDNVTLSCIHRNRTTKIIDTGFQAFYYKNGKLMRQSDKLSANVNFRSVTKDDEGLYKCNHLAWGSSHDSYLTVIGTVDRLTGTVERPPGEEGGVLESTMWKDNIDTENGVEAQLYSPVSWREYFDQMEDVSVGPADSRESFRVYKAGTCGPLLVLLHGGGHSALSWAVCTTAISSRVSCRVFAMDLRGHGATQVGQCDDFSTQTMSRDVANVVQACYGETPPPTVLIGHGVGGAIAVHAASNMLLPTIVGLVAIDVVEGSAMEVLHSMQSFLKGRPKSFKSMECAIEWSVKSGQIQNLESARVSVVGQIKKCQVEEVVSPERASPVVDVVVEGNEEFYDQNHINVKENTTPEVDLSDNQSVFNWRIDLSKAEKYWDGWFRGTSNLFLGCNLPKLLLLAGVDRLDRDLTIGQMQGCRLAQNVAL